MGISKIAGVVGLAVVASAAQAQTNFEQVAITLLANYLGYPTNQVRNFDSRYTIYDEAPAYVIAQQVQVEPRTIWIYRRQGHTWNQAALRYGMNQGTYNRLASQGYFTPDGRWVYWYSDYYNVQPITVIRLRRRGVPLRDVLYATCIAGRSRIPVDRVWTKYRTARNWDRVATDYRVDVRRLAPPKKYTVRRKYVIAPSKTVVTRVVPNRTVKIVKPKSRVVVHKTVAPPRKNVTKTTRVVKPKERTTVHKTVTPHKTVTSNKKTYTSPNAKNHVVTRKVVNPRHGPTVTKKTYRASTPNHTVTRKVETKQKGHRERVKTKTRVEKKGHGNRRQNKD
ncbi:hypothetical protein BH11ARM2_BH11ARM2_09050 [soil metagenome]